MGERGVVFALLVRNSKTGKVVSGPEIITKGLVQEDKEGWFIDEATRLIKRVIAKFEQEKKRMDSPPETDLQEAVRLELRRFFNQNLGKKPVVLSIVMDL